METKQSMNIVVTEKFDNKTVVPVYAGMAQSLMYKQWKGGRLKKRFDTHAQMKGWLTYTSSFVLNTLMACWLSPVADLKRFLRGIENKLSYLVLLIDKRSN